MKKSLIIFFLLSSCISSNTGIKASSCKLDRELVDDKKILEMHWDQKITLKGGSSLANISKVLDSKGQVYIFRDIKHRSLEDKIREISAHKIASEYGYGPYLEAYSLTKGKIVISLLESSKQTVTATEEMLGLVDSLKKMHNGPSFCNHLSIIDQVQELYSRTQYCSPKIRMAKIYSLIDQLIYLKEYPKKPTHRDLNPNNIFFTDTGVKFIDFENAAQDDPFFDIASIIVFYQYGSDEEEKFLKLYFGHELSEDDKEHLIMMKKAVYLFYGLTLLSKIPCTKNEIKTSGAALQDILKQVALKKFSLEKEENISSLSAAFLEEALK